MICGDYFCSHCHIGSYFFCPDLCMACVRLCWSVVFTPVLGRVKYRRSTRFKCYIWTFIDSRKMSNVRLSNGSPTLERTDARLSDHPKPTACRNLFGPVDHEELKRDLKGHLQEIEEVSSTTWNFDFVNHTPLNGKFEWKLVDCEKIPNFYSREQRSAKGVCPSGNTNVDLNGNHNCVAATPRQPCENTERSDSQMECKDQCTGQRKRSASHDPSSQNKRSHTSSDEVTRCPGITNSVEHTPRKNSPKSQTWGWEWAEDVFPLLIGNVQNVWRFEEELQRKLNISTLLGMGMLCKHWTETLKFWHSKLLPLKQSNVAVCN